MRGENGVLVVVDNDVVQVTSQSFQVVAEVVQGPQGQAVVGAGSQGPATSPVAPQVVESVR